MIRVYGRLYWPEERASVLTALKSRLVSPATEVPVIIVRLREAVPV
jgi:hypothetical protein